MIKVRRNKSTLFTAHLTPAVLNILLTALAVD